MNSPVVWITGAGSGIGRAIALGFASQGARVALTGRTVTRLEETAEQCRSHGGEALPLACDAANPVEVQSAVETITAKLGPVDVFVNNAGTTVFKPFLATRLEEFDAIHAVNLRGAFLCIQAVLPSMVERKGGLIVLINSIAAREVFKDSSVYAASKAGLRMMTDCLRAEVRKDGVRILSIYPGATNTEIWPERVREKFGDRMMTPSSIADILLHAWKLPPDVMLEELVMQPTPGALS